MANTAPPPPPLHIAILPTPGMGHLIPLAEFAKRLHLLHNISTTFIVPTNGPLSKAQLSLLSSLPPAIDYLLLPPTTFDDLPPDAKIETIICLTVTRSLPALRDAVRSLHETKNLAALVVDLFGVDGFDVAGEFKIPQYIFFPTTATCLSLFLHLQELDQTISGEFRDVPDKLQIPGCIPIRGSDLLDPVQDRKNDAYKRVLHVTNRYRLADGILVNSFTDLEPGPFEFLLKKEEGKPTIYPVGPLIQVGSKKDTEPSHASLKWLDEQPNGSVLYVCFGSGGTLSHDQIIELALGLEMSEQRFLWVTRCPNKITANATYFTVENTGDPLAYLPPGFLDRTRGKGLVVPMWAPQSEILAHGSTGGFLSHCGWNSTLESIVSGVPLIAWPLYAEQRMNTVMLHEDIKVAMKPKFGENGLVGRVEIANLVKGLMEGEEGKGVRSKMRELKDASARVLGEDGSSTKALAQFVEKLKKSD